jgi:DNA repair photolyase
LRPRLARLLEHAPRAKLRLTGGEELREAGLQVGMSTSPLPGITDGGELEEWPLQKTGAQWFFSGVLFL